MSTALVGWVADLLQAAWTRQEREGRYRGADDFRALHIDPRDALASRAALTQDAPWPAGVVGGFAAAAAELPTGLGLSDADAFVAVLATAVDHEPRLRPLVAALTDDPGLRLPTLGLTLELGAAVGLAPRDLRAALAPRARLDLLDLVHLVCLDQRPSPLDAALVASAWLISPNNPENIDPTPATTMASGRRRPTLLQGADHVSHAEAFAGGEHLAVRTVAQSDADTLGLGRAARDCLHAASALVVTCDQPPDARLVADVEAVAALGCPVAVSLGPGVGWIAPPRWPERLIAAPDAAARAQRWASALAADEVAATAADLAVVASEFTLGRDAIDDAAQRVAAARHPGPATLPALRRAARQSVWRDLSTCARRGPTGNTWDDLVVPPAIRTQLRDIADAIAVRATVLDEWGFGRRPGSRGYHVLFAGPSGTGKTMSAGVIAEETGLELWVVDLARVVDKYLGETEKAIDKVLRAAENSGAMLLFDEADALFGRRGEVREAKDRWANVEVAFLLQRIEEHDGVTVLTTNVSHHLDEAFARRMSQRVEFGLPDAGLRRLLWQRSMPDPAPLTDPDDLAAVADRFELAGGAIRSAALNAAYEAAAARRPIGLEHLVRATVRELTKAGRAPTRSDLGALATLVDGGVR